MLCKCIRLAQEAEGAGFLSAFPFGVGKGIERFVTLLVG
jgi:hypothetical protein